MKKVFGNIPAVPFVVFIIVAIVGIFLSFWSPEYYTLLSAPPCSGDLSFVLSPSTTTPRAKVNVSVNISSDRSPRCGGVYVLIKKGGCSNPSTITSCRFGDTMKKCFWGRCTYWHNCIAKLRASIDTGDHTYYACLDKNHDGNFDSDEYASAMLTVDCIDTDNGNKSVKGTCTDGTGTYEDKCKTKRECVLEIFGKCFDYDLVSYLEEYFCSDGMCVMKEIKCSCQNGSCISLDSCTPAGGKCSSFCWPPNKEDMSKSCPPLGSPPFEQKRVCCMPAEIIVISPENNSLIAQTSTILFDWIPARFSGNPNCSLTLSYPGGNTISSIISCKTSEQCSCSISSNQESLSIWPGGSYNWSVQCETIDESAISDIAYFDMTECGNGECEPPETYNNCPQDCPRGGNGGRRRCNENWSADDWAPVTCPSSGIQTRTWTDSKKCGTTRELKELNLTCVLQPDDRCIETRTCIYICHENWKCNEWSECVDGKHHRSCYDLNNCGTTFNKSITEETCVLPPRTCAELNGTICTENQVCEGNITETADTADCCIGICTAKKILPVLLTWIAIVLGIAVVVVIMFVILRYPRKPEKLVG